MGIWPIPAPVELPQGKTALFHEGVLFGVYVPLANGHHQQLVRTEELEDGPLVGREWIKILLVWVGGVEAADWWRAGCWGNGGGYG